VTPLRREERAALRPVHPGLVVEPDDEIRAAMEMLERFPDLGDLLYAAAILDASHLDYSGEGGAIVALENSRGLEAGIGCDFAPKQLVELLESSGLLGRINAPDVDENRTFAHRRTSLSRSQWHCVGPS
jgi:hypothetical protein